MKIVYEAFLLPKVGGGVRHFTGMSAALSRQGALVTEVLPRPTSVAAKTACHQRVHLPVGGPRLIQMAIYEALRATLCLWWALQGRRFDIWMSRYSLFGIGLVLARLVARQVVLEINGPPYEEMLANFGSRPMASAALGTMRLQAQSAHVVVAVTPGLAEYVRYHVPGVAAITIHNGADPDDSAFHSAIERDIPFVFAGALTRWYDLDVVLRAIASMRHDRSELRLRLVGDGVEKDALHRLVDELGLHDVVEFVGWVDGDQVRRELARARVGLLPLRSKGGTSALGSPLKLYDYIAAGLTVVGTDLDGVSNSPVRDAVYYYKAGDVISCAQTLRQSLDVGQQTAVDPQTWSWDSRAKKLLRALGLDKSHKGPRRRALVPSAANRSDHRLR